MPVLELDETTKSSADVSPGVVVPTNNRPELSMRIDSNAVPVPRQKDVNPAGLWSAKPFDEPAEDRIIPASVIPGQPPTEKDAPAPTRLMPLLLSELLTRMCAVVLEASDFSTTKVVAGDVVPMPTFPELSILTLSVGVPEPSGEVEKINRSRHVRRPRRAVYFCMNSSSCLERRSITSFE